MIESLWACLLGVSLFNRVTRLLAAVLVLKWAANYAAAYAGFWRAPAYLDIAFGTVGVLLALRLPHRRIGDVLVACFVLAPIFHGLYWLLYGSGTYVGVQYYVVMLGLFSAQVVALSWPGAVDLCLRLSRLWSGPVGWYGSSESAGAGRRDQRLTKSRPMR